MLANEYQKLAATTLVEEISVPILSSSQTLLLWNVIGLAGESGEFLELIKKSVFHKHEFELQRFKSELGDIFWYLAAIATGFGFSLEEIMQGNIDKLKARFPEGNFTVEGTHHNSNE